MFEKLRRNAETRRAKKESINQHDRMTEHNRKLINSTGEMAKSQLENGDFKGMAKSLGKMLVLGATERGREFGRDKISDAKNKTQVDVADFATRVVNKVGHETSKTIGRKK